MRTRFLALSLMTLAAAPAEARLLETHRQSLEDKGLLFEAVYTGEYWKNTSGGLKTDDTYLGNIDLLLTLDLEKIGIQNDAVIFAYVLNNHGGEKLTESILGDLQTVSNIEAPRTTRLYELWYEKNFSDGLSFLAGLHDYNADFNVTEYGGLFINSSFGITPELAAGGRPSVFPIASLGARVKITPLDNWQFLFGIYDGDPDDPNDVDHLPRLDFDRDGGVFTAFEAGYFYGNTGALPGSIKTGAWYNSGKFDDVADMTGSGEAQSEYGNYGLYFIVDQMLWREKDDQGLGVFVQAGAAPEFLNEISRYFGAGLSYKGLLPGRDEDEIGLAVARASISDDLLGRDEAETTYELTYRAVINDHLALQPDIQYVENPGAEAGRGNALVFGLRFEYAL